MRPFPRAATLLLLISAAFFLVLPDATNAQIWVTSGFTVTPGSQTVTAYCSTSAIDPATGLPSPAAADYAQFSVMCEVYPSTGAVINPSACLRSNPTGTCSMVFQPQQGVTYTIKSNHGLRAYFYPPSTQCGQYGPNPCMSDPLGYYSLSAQTSSDPPAAPTYSSNQSVFPVDVSCSTIGTCTPQIIPSEYCTETATTMGGAICIGIKVAPPWPLQLAQTSAQWPTCPAPTITSISPGTWYAGQTYNPVTITGTNFITTANATTSCPVSAVNVTTPSGTVIAVSNESVVSATQITATVAPPANEPTEIATVTVGTAPNTATSTVQIQALSAKITDTSDIMNGNVAVKLTAPSGTTGDLTLNFYGATSIQNQVLDINLFPSQVPGSQALKLDFDSVPPAIYSTADGTWNATLPGATAVQTVNVPDYTLPTPWTYFRNIFYTQYNIPHESECEKSANDTGDTDAWVVTTDVVKGKTICHFTPIKLNAQFIAATWMNGTGIDDGGDTLKNAVALNLGSGSGEICHGQYPQGAVGYTPTTVRNGKTVYGNGNTFAVVSSITGSCTHQTLIVDQSLAAPSSILSGVKALSCGDVLNLDDGDHTTASMRTVADLCPACSDTSSFSDEDSTMYGSDGHIDALSSSTSCTGHDVGNLGFFYTSYPTN